MNVQCYMHFVILKSKDSAKAVFVNNDKQLASH